MKLRIVLFLSVLIGVAAMFSPAARAATIHVEVGDRPYYHGNDFWDWGWRWVWVPGHWDRHHHHWIRGYYERRGDWNEHYVRHHHHWDHD